MIPRIYVAENARLYDDFFWDAADDDTICDPALAKAHYLSMRDRYLPHAAPIPHAIDVMKASLGVAKVLRGAWCVSSCEPGGYMLFCETAEDLRTLIEAL